MSAELPRVQLVDVDSSNWRSVAAVEPRPEQQRFVAPVTHYLCLAHYGEDWHPLAIEADGTIVGHGMWAYDAEEGSTWLGGLVIDAAHQGRGIGRAAVLAFLDRVAANGEVDAGLSYDPENVVARRLYLGIGFEETGEVQDGELVARYRGEPPQQRAASR